MDIATREQHMPAGGTNARQQNVIARMERLPFHFWHVKVRILIGVATFFDAFDAIMIAYILPVLVPLWRIPPRKIGLLISAGYLGQLVGALFFGWFAERYGRIRSLTTSVVILSLGSLACIFAGSLNVLIVLRVIQGFGLGGEVPIAAAYINEVSKAKGRGVFFCVYETLFAFGLLCAAAIGYVVVPKFGWQAMFLIGMIPAFMVPFYIRSIPESPRWLANKGRLDEAEKVVADLERITTNNQPQSLPAIDTSKMAGITAKPTRLGELFQGMYLGRTITVWALWFLGYFLVYGLVLWAPTLFTTVYKVPLAQALRYSLIAQTCAVISTLFMSVTIDLIGRKTWLTILFIGATVPLAILYWRGAHDAHTLFLLYTVFYIFTSPIAVALYLYTPEVYPTRMRAIGCGLATSWLRIANIVSPMLVAVMVSSYSIGLTFGVLAIISILGAAVAAFFAIETKEKVLEQLAP